MKKSTFAVLLASALGLFPVAPAFADKTPKLEICPELGLPPLPPNGTCADQRRPRPPTNKCEQYVMTRKNDGKGLSDEEFNHLLKLGTFELSLCEPLFTEEQRKKFEKARIPVEQRLKSKIEFDDRP